MKSGTQERIKFNEAFLDNVWANIKLKMIYLVRVKVITQLSKSLLERMLNAEMDYHLNDKSTGREVGNTHNGYGKKTVKNNAGAIEISTSRDRQSTFEPRQRLKWLL